MLSVLWAVVAISTVLGWIGLLYLIREARLLYLGSWLAYLVLLLLGGPVVDAAVGSVLQMLTALVGGAILGLVYLSELGAEFRPLAAALQGRTEDSG